MEKASDILNTIFGSNTKWKKQAQWCQLFRHQSWVLNRWTDIEYDCPAGASIALRIPTAVVYDVSHFQVDDKNIMFKHVQGRKIVTSPMSLEEDFLNYRAIKSTCQNGYRYFINKEYGRLSACDAFQDLINPEHKLENQSSEAFVRNLPENEILVDLETLKHVFRMMSNINASGGFATCSVEAAGGWYAIRNMYLLGPEKDHGPETMHRVTMLRNQSVGFQGGCMVELSPRITTLQKVKKHTTAPVLSQPPYCEGKWLYIPCSIDGWEINVEKGTVDTVHMTRKVKLVRPLYERNFSIDYKSSKSGCAKLDLAEQKFKLTLSDHSPLAVLGACVEQPDGRDYVKLSETVRKLFQEVLKDPNESLAVYYEKCIGDSNKDTAGKKILVHQAGWKGSQPVYRMRLMAKIGHEWYWLDTMKPTGELQPSVRCRPKYILLEN